MTHQPPRDSAEPRHRTRNILVFAATGAIGSGTARVLADRGAHVWVSGRDGQRTRALANELTAAGGAATAHVVDATDPKEIDAYLGEVVDTAGRIDGSFNAIGLPPAELGYPARSDDLDIGVFLRPMQVILASTFATSRASARAMAGAGEGAVVTLSSTLTGGAFGFMAALTATCGAIEAMTRALSGEYGPAGVRVNCVRGDAMPETSTIQQTGAAQMALMGVDGPQDPPATPLGRPLTVADTAKAVAFLLSDEASGLSSQVMTVSGSPLAGG